MRYRSILLLTLTMVGCSAAHGVRPLGAGQTAMTASLGGPIVRLPGQTTPAPMSTIGVRHGRSDRSDLHGAVNLTALGLVGVLMVDLGASYLLVDQRGSIPAVVVDSHLLLGVGGTGEGLAARAAAEAELLCSWSIGKDGHLAYAGLDAFLQPPDAADQLSAATPAVILGPLLGMRPVLGERLTVPVQVTWLNPWMDTTNLTLEYPSPGHRGALQVELGVGVRLGGAR